MTRIRLTIELDLAEATAMADHAKLLPVGSYMTSYLPPSISAQVARAIAAALPSAVELPDPIKVGDTVENSVSGSRGSVIALNGDYAWVNNGLPYTARVETLRKVTLLGKVTP